MANKIKMNGKDMYQVQVLFSTNEKAEIFEYWLESKAEDWKEYLRAYQKIG